MWDKEINISEIEGLLIGNAQDQNAKTGVTVLVFPEGASVGCKISGGGPASRETGLTYSETADNRIHAIVLSGGSAYGLAASQGVMETLEKHGIGYKTPFATVPLVCQSCIFDLNYGSNMVRPTPEMGAEACENALENTTSEQGCVGVGTGATAGKLRSMKNASKTGLGWYAVRAGELQAAAVVVVNAMGDIYDSETGEKLAGMLTDDRTGWVDAEEYLAGSCGKMHISSTGQNGDGWKTGSVELRKFRRKNDGGLQNTTLGVFVTNAQFHKAQMNKIASMTQNAYARCIRPVGTMKDGDTVYAASMGTVQADLDYVGTLAAKVMERAIRNAVCASTVSEQEFLRNIRMPDS